MSAEMSVGEAFMFLGSTVHAGGANRTSQPRPMHGFFYCRSYLRPEVSNCCPRMFCLLASTILYPFVCIHVIIR